MKTAELSETSTTEEVQQYAETVAKEVEADRTEEKDDSRITAEHANNEHKETPAEDKSGSDTVESEATDEDESWITDDLKTETAAYGIDEAELAEFANREELDRALRLFDKTALEAGRKAMAEEKVPEQPKESEKPKEGGYKVSLDAEEWDERIVGEFTRMRDHYESRLDSLESRFVESDVKAQEQHFDNLVDSLGHKDLLGKTGQEDAKQLQRRQDLHVAVKAQLLGLEQLGRPTELDESLVNRVAKMVFAEDFDKTRWKNKTRKVSKQSNGRQGGGATRPQDPREDPGDEFDRLYKEMGGST